MTEYLSNSEHKSEPFSPGGFHKVVLKQKLKSLFSHFFVVPQKAFIKTLEAPQRSMKIEI